MCRICFCLSSDHANDAPDPMNPSGVLAGVPADLFVDGQWRPAEDGLTFAVAGPGTRRCWARRLEPLLIVYEK